MAHFTLERRKMLYEMLQTPVTYREISNVMTICPSAISDEIKNNGGKEKYDPYRAHERARLCALRRYKRKKLEININLKQRVLDDLSKDYSPEQIAGRLRKEAQGRTIISHETIYLFIYSKEGKKEKLWLHLRHRKKPERKHWGSRTHRTKIPDRVSIHERPEIVNIRTVFGHWEADLMQFSDSKKTLAVFVERKTRRTVAVVNEDKGAKAMYYALHELIATVGQTHVHSITFDNGLENVCHSTVRSDYAESFVTYFCDSYCSWQKGTVENTNKLLRQYFPRHITDNEITQDNLDRAIRKLNARPRKTLNYNTPIETFILCSV